MYLYIHIDIGAYLNAYPQFGNNNDYSSPQSSYMLFILILSVAYFIISIVLLAMINKLSLQMKQFLIIINLMISYAVACVVTLSTQAQTEAISNIK